VKNAFKIDNIRYVNIAILVLALLVIFGAFSLYIPRFATVSNVEMLARQSTMVCVAALGMTYIIILGGIDLSVGSVMAFVAVVVAWMLQRKYDPLMAAAAGVAAGTLCGFVNGLLISQLKVVPFIVTLGSYLAVRGAAKGLAGEQKIDAPISWLNDLLAKITPENKHLIFPLGVWILIVMAVLVGLMLKYTRFGRYVVAVGSNEQAARLCGVPVERVKLLVYTLGGFCVGLSGLFLFSRLSVGDPTAAVGTELDVIAAVVIGGASLSGGEGSIVGSLIGAFLMVTLKSGGTQLGWPNWLQEIITGGIILVSVALDKLRTLKASRA